MPPPMMISVARSSRFSMMRILSETLAPPMMAVKGFCDWCRTFSALADFAFHQQAEHPFVPGEKLGDDGRGSMGAVGGAEGVVDIDVAELGELFGEGLIAFFLFFIEAEVFQQQHLAGFELAAAVVAASPIQSLAKSTVVFDSPGPLSSSCRWGTRCLREYLSVGPSLGRPRWLIRMTLPPSFRIFLNGGDGCPHAGIVGDLEFVVERDVKIHPDQGFFICKRMLAELTHKIIIRYKKGPGLSWDRPGFYFDAYLEISLAK
jgi:hypothetical protein